MASIDGSKRKERSISSSSSWSFDEEFIGDFDAVTIDAKPKPKEKYPAKLHARSVAKHLGVKDGLIYLPGWPPINYEDSDQPMYFRQRRYFYYLSGIDFPGCYVSYDIRRDQLIAWIPPPNSGSSVIFNGSVPSREEVSAKYDFDLVSCFTLLHKYVTHFVQNEDSKVYLLHDFQRPANIPTVMPHKNGVKDPFDSLKLKAAMDAARVIKSPYEIKLLRKANDITAQAHTNVLRGIKTLKNEAEIEAIFAATCIAQQAKKQAYGIIAASGPNASTLHYIANNESLEGRELVCLDAGCEWECYAADVTRTFPISGDYSKEAKEIYDIVAKMQEECIDMVKPGANYREIHLHAHKVATEELMKLGLLKGDFDELYKAGAAVAFFPHGLGHYLGLECHDVGDCGNLLLGFNAQSIPQNWPTAVFNILNDPSPKAASVLAANMVITVEPGIYFSKYALEEVFLKDSRYAKFINKDLLDKYYPIGGVRIEDDILVTDEGYENLTKVPKGEEALKIINGDWEEVERIEEEKGKWGWFW